MQHSIQYTRQLFTAFDHVILSENINLGGEGGGVNLFCICTCSTQRQRFIQCFSGSMILWFNGPMALCFNVSLVSAWSAVKCLSGSLVVWVLFNGSLVVSDSLVH